MLSRFRTRSVGFHSRIVSCHQRSYCAYHQDFDPPFVNRIPSPFITHVQGRRIDDIHEITIESLEKGGHTCIETSGDKFSWCCSEPCNHVTRDIDATNLEIALSLKKRGHKCLVLTSIFPRQFEFCGHDPCTHK